MHWWNAKTYRGLYYGGRWSVWSYSRDKSIQLRGIQQNVLKMAVANHIICLVNIELPTKLGIM